VPKPKRTPIRTESAPTLESLARRLAETERLVSRLVKCPTVLHELRMIEAEEQAKAARQRHADGQAKDREKRKAERAAWFEKFACERLAVHPTLSVALSQVVRSFDRWCNEHAVPGADRMTADELAEAVCSFPEIARCELHPPGYMGQRPPLEPGFTGVGLCPDGVAPCDVVSDCERRRRTDEADRQARYERLKAHSDREQQFIDEWRRTREAAMRGTATPKR